MSNTTGPRSVNLNAQANEQNFSLFNILLSNVDTTVIELISNDNIVTGTGILKMIHDNHASLADNKVTVYKHVTQLENIKWDPSTESIHDFTSRFMSHVSHINRSQVTDITPVSFPNAKRLWICALPQEYFHDLQIAHNKDALSADWQKCDKFGQLPILTMFELDNTNKVLPPIKSSKPRNLPHTNASSQSKKHKDPNLSNANLSLETKKCRKPDKDESREFGHTSNNCPILKKTFSYLDSPLSSSRPSSASSNTYPPSNPITCKATTVPTNLSSLALQSTPNQQSNSKAPPLSTKMLYDTGTYPKSLCRHKEYFSELMLYKTPKHVQLGDPSITSEALGQGIIDIIINHQYRAKFFCYYTPTTDSCMAANDHLSYAGNTLFGKNGTLHIAFPTFSFETLGRDHFEFDISPGKDSNLPILWEPNNHNVIRDFTFNNNVSIKRLSPHTIIPRRSTNGSTGYDVASSIDISIPPASTVKVPLGFAIQVPSHLQCELRPRSGMSTKQINIALGTIDPDYQNEVMAIVTNNSSTVYNIHIGQRIGQLVFSPITYPSIQEVKSFNTPTSTHTGFGSTDRPTSRRNRPSILPTIYEDPAEMPYDDPAEMPSDNPTKDTLASPITIATDINSIERTDRKSVV